MATAKVLVLILIAAGAAVGIVFYQTHSTPLSESIAVNSVTRPSVVPESTSNPTPPSSFSFNPLGEPRALPDMRFVDSSGRGLALTDFKGKLVLLNVWATWCGPCRVEMPALDRLQAKMGGNDFEVMALSIDVAGLGNIEEFYKELRLSTLQIYIDETLTAPLSLDILGIPTTLLIDRQGREIGRVIGPAEWDSEEVIAAIRFYLDAPKATGETTG